MTTHHQSMHRYQVIWQEYLYSGNRFFEDGNETKVLSFGESAIMGHNKEEVKAKFRELFPYITIQSVKQFEEPHRVGFFNVWRRKE